MDDTRQSIGADSKRRQITHRLLGIFIIFCLFWIVSILILYIITLNHYNETNAKNNQDFYLGRITQIEADWKSEAFAFKTNLELLDIFHQDKDWRDILHNYLILLGEDVQFARIRILDKNNALQFDSITDAPIQELIINHDNYLWHFEPVSQTLFWVIQIPIWLNNGSIGHLQLFKPIDNSLLFNNHYPYTHLHLLWRDNQIAYSDRIEDTFSELDIFLNQFRIVIPWTPGKTDVMLKIHQTLPTPISIWSVLTTTYFTITLFGGIILLFLTNWFMHLTRRILQLRTITKNFIDNYQFPPKRDLDFARNRPDELTDLANMLENLIFTVQLRDSERDRTEQELRNTHQSLEVYQQQLEQLVISRTAELELSEEKIRLILDSNAAGVFGTDSDGRITFINPAACAILGYRAEEVINQYAHLTLHHSREDGSPYPMEECPITHSLTRGEVNYSRREIFWRANGEKIPITYASQPIRKNGQIIGLVVSFFDISEQVKVEDALKWAMLEAQRLERVKSNFLASMSHEIRTPMNSIIGFCELALQDSMIRSLTKGYLHTILKSARLLLTIINDILDISKLEGGHIALEKICFNLPNALKYTLRTVEQHALNKYLTLNLELDNALPRRCWGDPIRLNQVLLNLVDNAIKFTEKGSITVTVKPSAESETYHFAISDTGIGMTSDQLGKIFDPFTQADQSTTRRFGGTGLGTTLARQIVELMGGKIWVESQFEIGSTFHFTVPLPEAPNSPDCLYDDENEAVPNEYNSPRQFRILLAEDQEENASLVMLRLQQHGHCIIWVKNGREAIDTYLHDHFDLILMDVMMPKLDGLTATEEIRKIEKEFTPNSMIPIIALTASVMHEDNQKCMRAGMNALIPKPIEFNKLLFTMEQVAPQHAGRPNIRPRPKSYACHCPSELDFSVLRGIVDYPKAIQTWGDPLLYARALISFTKSHAHDIDQLLLDAGDIENNPPDRKIIHSLKGLAGNLSLTKVAELATEIDTMLGMREKVDLSKLHELRHTLEEAFNAIRELCLPEEDDSPQSLSKSNPKTVNRLLNTLLEELDGLNPDTIEPVLIKLAMYIDNTKLKPLWECVNNFDFEGASTLVPELFLPTDENSHGQSA